ncbi:hypothetical protein Tco_0935343 [Tanacetum coccineum]
MGFNVLRGRHFLANSFDVLNSMEKDEDLSLSGPQKVLEVVANAPLKKNIIKDDIISEGIVCLIHMDKLFIRGSIKELLLFQEALKWVEFKRYILNGFSPSSILAHKPGQHEKFWKKMYTSESYKVNADTFICILVPDLRELLCMPDSNTMRHVTDGI